jgi:hypothetical protein
MTVLRAYTLSEAGLYEEIEPDELGQIRSRVLRGFWLDPGWLAANPLPYPLDIMADISPDHFGGFGRADQ